MVTRALGFYWVRYPAGRNVWTVGEYRGPGEGQYPWQIVGSDSIFREEELEIGEAIPRPTADTIKAYQDIKNPSKSE